MAGFIICCSFLCFVAICIVLYTLITLIYNSSYLETLKTISIYTITIFTSLTLIIYAITKIHELATFVLKTKLENKEQYNKSILKQSLKPILKLVITNLALFTVFLYTTYKTEIWFLKYPMIVYICIFLGYTASYPFSDNLSHNIVDNTGEGMMHLKMKTIINSLIFLSIYFGYSYIINKI